MFSRATFSERIKRLRIEGKITQLMLAEHLGVTRTQVSDMENNKTTTSVKRLATLADYFDISADYLLGRTDNPDSHKS